MKSDELDRIVFVFVKKFFFFFATKRINVHRLSQYGQCLSTDKS